MLRSLCCGGVSFYRLSCLMGRRRRELFWTCRCLHPPCRHLLLLIRPLLPLAWVVTRLHLRPLVRILYYYSAILTYFVCLFVCRSQSWSSCWYGRTLCLFSPAAPGTGREWHTSQVRTSCSDWALHWSSLSLWLAGGFSRSTRPFSTTRSECLTTFQEILVFWE